MQNGFPGRQDVVPGRPLSPVAPLCHTAGIPAALAQKENTRYAYSVDIFLFVILLCVISVWVFFLYYDYCNRGLSTSCICLHMARGNFGHVTSLIGCKNTGMSIGDMF